MLKRVVPVIAVAAAVSSGAAFAFTFAPAALVGTMVIHASGGTTLHTSGAASSRPPAPSTPASTPTPASTGGSLTSTPPAPQALPATAPGAVTEGAPGAAPAKADTSARGGIAPRRGQGGQPVPLVLSVRKVAVALLNGGKISAMGMHAGFHDTLTVRNGKTVVAVALAQIADIEFGEKELGRLAVTVTMIDGSALSGGIYPGTVFEFEGKGKVTATRAEEIATITFPAE